MGRYRNSGRTTLKFRGRQPYGPGEEFRADLSVEQERLLVTSGSLVILEATEQPAVPEPPLVPAVQPPLAAGEDPYDRVDSVVTDRPKRRTKSETTGA